MSWLSEVVQQLGLSTTAPPPATTPPPAQAGHTAAIVGLVLVAGTVVALALIIPSGRNSRY